MMLWGSQPNISSTATPPTHTLLVGLHEGGDVVLFGENVLCVGCLMQHVCVVVVNCICVV